MNKKILGAGALILLIPSLTGCQKNNVKIEAEASDVISVIETTKSSYSNKEYHFNQFKEDNLKKISNKTIGSILLIDNVGIDIRPIKEYTNSISYGVCKLSTSYSYNGDVSFNNFIKYLKENDSKFYKYFTDCKNVELSDSESINKFNESWISAYEDDALDFQITQLDFLYKNQIKESIKKISKESNIDFNRNPALKELGFLLTYRYTSVEILKEILVYSGDVNNMSNKNALDSIKASWKSYYINSSKYENDYKDEQLKYIDNTFEYLYKLI